MAITTVADVKARCKVDPATHCWNWTGATSYKRQPAMHAFDHARGEKRTMTGTLAVWNIAHGAAPAPGRLIYRACGNSLCLNPAHLREAASLADIGLHQRRSGIRKGTALEARRRNIRIAQAAAGVVLTPEHVVRAIKQAPANVTGRALARDLGASESTVSRIRRGESHREVA